MNVTEVADTGRAIIEEAIATSGTLVTISRDPDDLDTTVDLDTLAVTNPTPATTVATGVHALIVTSGPTDVPTGPARVTAEPTFRVLLPIAVTDVQQGDTLTVTATRDSHLTGAQLLVTAVLDDALGIVRQVEARRLP